MINDILDSNIFFVIVVSGVLNVLLQIIIDRRLKKVKELDGERLLNLRIDVVKVPKIFKRVFIYSRRRGGEIAKQIYYTNIIFYSSIIVYVICLIIYSITNVQKFIMMGEVCYLMFTILIICFYGVISNSLATEKEQLRILKGEAERRGLYDKIKNKRNARIEKNRIKKELRKERRGRKTVWNKVRRILIITFIVIISLLVLLVVTSLIVYNINK